MTTGAKPKKFGVLGLAICALGVSLLIPWAFHMGHRFTPLYWTGTGTLQTKSGNYPVYVLIYPTMQRADGLQGWGSLCASRGNVVPLNVKGSFSNAWWSLDHASMEIALLETQGVHDQLFDPDRRGGFDLLGSWHGPELVLASNGEHTGSFRSGLKIEDASLTLKWGNKSDFNNACSTASTASRDR